MENRKATREYNKKYAQANRERLRVYHQEYYETHKKQNRLRSIWNAMRQRCKSGHKYYGDKGIRVCAEWADFEVFKKWANQNGYNGELTLDRVDGNKDYCPANCRWVSRREQQRNTSYNVNLTFNGETHCVREWSEITGISEHALRNRVRREWDIERALTTRTGAYRKEKV